MDPRFLSPFNVSSVVVVGAAVFLGAASPAPSISEKLLAREFILVDQALPR
jgi:hypothetical protein